MSLPWGEKRNSSAKRQLIEMESSINRLSRVPNKNKITKNDISSQPKEYALKYFSEHPDESDDTRAPAEKISEINDLLDSEEISLNKKFKLLVHKKILTSLVYGELSKEAMDSIMDLAEFYNQNNRPESSKRLIHGAKGISEEIGASKEDKFRIAVESATSYMQTETSSDSERFNNIQKAGNALKKYTEYESDNKYLMYRRDLIFARSNFYFGEYQASISFYEKAYESLDIANQGKQDEQVASLMCETAHCIEIIGDLQNAADLYRNANSIYDELELKKQVEKTKEKIRKLEEKIEKKRKEEKENQPKPEITQPKLNTNSRNRTK